MGSLFLECANKNLYILTQVDSHWNYEENVFNVSFVIVPVGLALMGARTSAGTTMTKFRSRMYTRDRYPKG